MANGYSGDYAVKLPSIFLQPGQALQQAISVNERQKEAEREEARYQQQRQREDDSRKAAMLERNSDPLKYYTGVQMFDQWADSKTMEILDRFTNDPKYRNMDFTTFTGELNKAWLPIVQGHKLVKGKLNQELESINQLTAQNKWLDKDLLTRGVYSEISKSFFQPNEKGETDFVPVDRANVDRSITGELLSGDNAINYVSNQAVDEFMKTFGKLPSESESFLLRTPEGGTAVYKGQRSPFQTANVERDQFGFVKGTPKYEVITEGRTDEMGNPIMTIPNELMESFVTNTTGNKMVYEKLFREYAQNQNIDISKLTPAQLEIEKGKFNYTLAKNTIQNQPDLFQYQRPPQGNTFNINTNQAQPFNPETTGVEFDRIGEDTKLVSKSGVTIANGVATDSQGNPVSAEIYVPVSQIPAGVSQIAMPYIPEKLRPVITGYKIRTNANGKITAIQPSLPSSSGESKIQFPWITRQDAYNAQLEINKEPQKGQQKVFGQQQGKQPFNTKPKQNDPLNLFE